jgi:hypothetical protein
MRHLFHSFKNTTFDNTSIVGLGTFLVYSTDVGSQALARLGKKFEDLKNTASKSFGAIGTLLAKGDIGGAAKILWSTAKELRNLFEIWAQFEGFPKANAISEFSRKP